MSALARVGRLVRVEAQKVLGGRGLLVGLLAVAAVTALTGWTHSPDSAYETAWTRTAAALGAGLWAAEIFLLVAGTTTIAGETAAGTLKMILPHAYRRSDWIVAKALVLAAQAVVLLATAIAVAAACGAASGGLGDVTRTTDELGLSMGPETLQSGGAMAGYLTQSALVSLAALVTTAWVGLWISCLFDAVVPAVSAGFLLFLGFKSAGTLFGAGPEVLESIYAWYPGAMLDRLEDLGKALNEAWREGMAPRGLRLSAVVAAVSLAGSLIVFMRRDLQS